MAKIQLWSDFDWNGGKELHWSKLYLKLYLLSYNYNYMNVNNFLILPT